MTLIVAGISDGIGWLVADALISGGNIGIRDRRYAMKAAIIGDFAVAAFAGDFHKGQSILARLSHCADVKSLIDRAASEARLHRSVDLLLLARNNGYVELMKVTAAGISSLSQAHIGSAGAFEAFQDIRHRPNIDHAPHAQTHMVWGSYLRQEVPVQLSTATTAMFTLFAERSEKDVGGWATAFMVGADGAALAPYGFNTTDQIEELLTPGFAIPHGTAAGGGFSISVTGLADNRGIAIYWPQAAMGRIFLRTEQGYDEHTVTGGPAEFRERGSKDTGCAIELWFSDEPLGTIEAIDIFPDENGLPRIAVAKSRGRFNFAWVGNVTDDPFKTAAPIDLAPMSDRFETADGKALSVTPVDQMSVLLQLDTGAPVRLTAEDVDSLIRLLAMARTRLQPPIDVENPPVGRPHIVEIDPVWRATQSPHAAVPGILLWLRNTGSGWAGYVLPPHECRTLGGFLVEHAPKGD